MLAGAQVRPDSVRRDTTAAPPLSRAAQDTSDAIRARAREDSLRAADTLKAPIARFEIPNTFELTGRLSLTREQILSSNAPNLADLLDRVPGVTSFRSGWLGGVHVASYQSDFARIRYFVDGVELDALQPRDGGVLDLTDVPLWTLDGLVIERVAGEVRVWMQSWSTDRTTAYTRADVFTGDLNTNGFRALFARRYRNGLALQFGGQQVATQTGRVSALSNAGSQRSAGDGSQQMVNVRLGWARGLWTADLYANGSTRDRDPQTAREDFTDLPAFKGNRREGYARVAYGDTARGLWGHGIVNLLRTRIDGIRSTTPPTNGDTEVDSARSDTIAGRTQQIVALGYRANVWQVSVLDRVRPVAGVSIHAPAARASIGNARFGVGGYGEYGGLDSTRRIDVTGRALVFPWLGITGSFSDRTPTGDRDGLSTQNVRLEGALRYRGVWISAGGIQAKGAEFNTPVLLGTESVRLTDPSTATGVTGSVHGKVYKDLSLDMGFERWNTPQFGRPKLRVRTEVALISEWRRKFPKGQFGVDARVTHEWRDRVPFFFATSTTTAPADIRNAERYSMFTGQLQLRLQRASLFYVYRNLTGNAYEQIPGLTMPPAVQMYGMRWEFFN